MKSLRFYVVWLFPTPIADRVSTLTARASMNRSEYFAVEYMTPVMELTFMTAASV